MNFMNTKGTESDLSAANVILKRKFWKEKLMRLNQLSF